MMSNPLAWYKLFIILCGIGTIAALFLPQRRIPSQIAWVGSAAALAVAGIGCSALFSNISAESTLWRIPSLGAIILRCDPLSGIFLLVTGAVFLPTSIFAMASLHRLPGRSRIRAYAVMYFGLLAAIVWILTSADVFSFLVAWELMSILCYLLVNTDEDKKTNARSGYRMLAVGEAGALAVMLGLLLLAAKAGSLSFMDLKTASAGYGAMLNFVIFLLTFFGFGVKAGLVPVNFWLPPAYTAAPDPFVPVLAGATLNLGLYGIMRVDINVLSVSSMTPGLIALIVGTISALIGILYATTENDLKTVLAHSSVENAGIITVGIGAGLIFTAAGRPVLAGMAFLVALYHMMNHSTYKTLLFIGTGTVADRAGTRDLDQLGGLIHKMPKMALFFLAGIMGIIALPPFNGFVSEWLTLQTLLRSAVLPLTSVKIVFALCGAGLALTIALAVTCFVKVFAMGFLGMARSQKAERATEARSTALAPMAILALFCLLLGILPTYVIGGLNRAVHPLVPVDAAQTLVPPFFSGAAGHRTLPSDFRHDFHDLGAQVGQSIAPGPGLVILHRGGAKNPVVFAVSPTYLFFVLIGMLIILYAVVRWVAKRRRKVVRGPCWDGGIRHLLPEMTYTATGFSNPVRVIFQNLFRPITMEDTRETVANYFRIAIHRQEAVVHIVDRLVLNPIRALSWKIARLLAKMHHGRLNAYVAYILSALLVILLLNRLL